MEEQLELKNALTTPLHFGGLQFAQTTPHSYPFGYQVPDFGTPLRPLASESGHLLLANEPVLGDGAG